MPVSKNRRKKRSQLVAPNLGTGARLHFPATQHIPDPGTVPMRCGKCGHTTFGVFVQTMPMLEGKIFNLCCCKCRKEYRVTGDGFVESGGKLDIRQRRTG